MQKLLPLKMFGTGTADVEAFPSYLVRLAASHSVTTGHLLRLLLGEADDPSLAAGIQSQPFAGLVRPNKTTKQVLERTSEYVIESLVNLSQGTFIQLLPALQRSSNSYSRSVRWCPACLDEQVASHQEPHLKLVWFFNDMAICGTHRIKLRDRCPTCARPARPMNRWPSIAICQSCEAPLTVVCADDVIQLKPEAAAPDLYRLVGDLAGQSIPFPQGGVNRYIDQVFHTAWASNREQELWSRLPRDDCIRYALPGEPVTLPAARRIAYLLEIPISELLEGMAPVVQSFGFASEQFLPAFMRPAKRASGVDRKALNTYLLNLLEVGTPISLRQAAREMGTTVGAMRYHFPCLVSRLSTAWAEYLASELIRKRTSARDATFEAILSWRLRHIKPVSRKALLAELFRETGIPKNVLREAIREYWLPALRSLASSARQESAR